MLPVQKQGSCVHGVPCGKHYSASAISSTIFFSFVALSYTHTLRATVLILKVLKTSLQNRKEVENVGRHWRESAGADRWRSGGLIPANTTCSVSSFSCCVFVNNYSRLEARIPCAKPQIFLFLLWEYTHNWLLLSFWRWSRCCEKSSYC